MAEQRSTFYTDTTLSKLASSENIEDLALGMMMLVHKNRGIAEVRARRFFLVTGENRSVLKDYELDSEEVEEATGVLSPDQNIKIKLSTASDLNTLSNYLNTGEEKPVKALIVKLISSGIMYDILQSLDIKRGDLLIKINQYYDSIVPRINSEFSKFLFKYPFLEKDLYSRAEIYSAPRIDPIVKIFKERKEKTGEQVSEKDIEEFTKDLIDVRNRVKELYEPPERDLYNLFGVLATSTFRRNLIRAQNELGQMLSQK